MAIPRRAEAYPGLCDGEHEEHGKPDDLPSHRAAALLELGVVQQTQTIEDGYEEAIHGVCSE
jgi:hypothetical protein